ERILADQDQPRRVHVLHILWVVYTPYGAKLAIALRDARRGSRCAADKNEHCGAKNNQPDSRSMSPRVSHWVAISIAIRGVPGTPLRFASASDPSGASPRPLFKARFQAPSRELGPSVAPREISRHGASWGTGRARTVRDRT